ncbi:MAG: outer membrane lipoprotein-sorting protein [Methylococcales bacterium]|nr:outer membrane lipoprotein-sorting protein [Methylococcales bacterium]
MKKLLLALTLSLFSLSTFALTPEEQGLQIAQEVDKRDTGFGDSRARLEMVLKNRSGDESRRSLELKTLEINGDGDKSLTIFDTPRDVKGTAFLSFTHALTPDDQWLYLPALKRVKRISSSNKSGAFLGSEYSFEDLTSFEIARYSYRYLKDEMIDGIDCFVIELKPQYEYSGYTRLVSWIDKTRYIPIKGEFYDRKNALLKTQDFKEYKRYLDKYWRAAIQTMTNQQNGKSTQLLWEDYEFGIGFTERDFDKNTLKRSR